MDKNIVNQKEYLKKYLSSKKDGHKKKKKSKVRPKKPLVIDDDDEINLKNMRPIEADEFEIFLDSEDAPQIAGIVDDRGPVDFTDKTRWKIITDDIEGDVSFAVNNTKKSNKNVMQPDNDSYNEKKSKKNIDSHKKRKKRSIASPSLGQSDVDSDSSPPRKRKDEGSDLSPPRREKDEDSDLSPPRRRNDEDSDLSPPRKRKDEDSDLSPPRKRKDEDSDLSPPRKRKDEDSDLSPPRKRKGRDSDLSPPRRKKRWDRDTNSSPLRQRKDEDLDLSPPRRRKDREEDSDSRRLKERSDSHKHSNYSKSTYRHGNQNPVPREHYRELKDNHSRSRRNKYEDSRSFEKIDKSNRDSNSPHIIENSNSNPLRSKKQYDMSDETRNGSRKHSRTDKTYKEGSSRKNSNIEYSDSLSQSRNNRYDSEHNQRREFQDDDRVQRNQSRSKPSNSQRDESPPHKHDNRRKAELSSDKDERMKKTLDGKKAGLQSAKTLREEAETLKKQEMESFSKLGKELSGAGQATVLRDSRTGRKRNLEAEAADKYEKEQRQQELNEKYMQWGKGLKQVQDHEEKLKDDLHESNKPLARYANDTDLDKQLREQEREGDPMLEYIKAKQIKEGKRQPDTPRYEGSYMPNRFGIKPGHRWDGVDRSNGYEKKWFEAQNAKKALEVEAYKWSTADM